MQELKIWIILMDVSVCVFGPRFPLENTSLVFFFVFFFQPTQPLRRTSLNIQRPFRISATSLAVLLRWERKQQETRLTRVGGGGVEGVETLLLMAKPDGIVSGAGWRCRHATVNQSGESNLSVDRASIPRSLNQQQQQRLR